MKWFLLLFLIAYPVNAFCQPRIIILEKKEKKEPGHPERVWNRDPFATPGEAAGKVPAGEQSDSLKISAIMLGPNRAAAVINGQTVRVGDVLFDMKVIDISKNSVILRPVNNRGIQKIK